MVPAVLGLLLGCLAIASAQVVSDSFPSLCQNNYDATTLNIPAPGYGCKAFISCYGPEYHGLLQCPEKTLFSEVTQKCEDEDEESLNCRVSENRNEDCQTGVVPYNCSAFTYCYLDTEYSFSCNQDLYYSESKLICTYAYDLTEEDRSKCNFYN